VGLASGQLRAYRNVGSDAAPSYMAWDESYEQDGLTHPTPTPIPNPNPSPDPGPNSNFNPDPNPNPATSRTDSREVLTLPSAHSAHRCGSYPNP